ncbi:MAG: hypothetical protein LBO09_08315 [Candidatus Peribacteria bacterium]|jgi:polysaccharide pyruvyl transferase WcaK-like protein|nr:hypothetical protein [Candidatus Peribacteria bacterium]
MDTSYFAYEWETVSSLKKDPYIIVNICDQRFVEQIAEEITPYLQQGYHLLYVPIFQSRGQGQSDITFKHSLEQLLSLDTPLEVLDWKEDFSHFVEVLAGAEKVICTRLHLFLVASYLKRPTEVFPYQKKILKMQKVIQKIFPLSA